jgi:uncharacterized protein (DUF1499 family)
MARRRMTEDPVSRLAIWARRLALFALVAVVLSIIVVRSGLLEIEPALATFGGALVLAAIAILLAFGALIFIWRDGLGGLGYAVSALAIGLAILAYPAYLGLKAYRLPAIADVTTDPIDPPRFEAIARIRPRVANPVVYAGLYAAEQQRNAYPDVEPLLLEASPTTAYEGVLAVVTRHKWRIVDSREPIARRRDGHIEAVARTPIMGFRDDIVIRIRPNGDGARVDVRSASRYGRHDFGTNAAPVITLLGEIDEVVGTEQEKQEKKQEQQQKKQQKTPQKTPAKAQTPAKR